jgi:hypothetical protein
MRPCTAISGPRLRVRSAALVLALVVVAGGCGGGASPDPTPEPVSALAVSEMATQMTTVLSEHASAWTARDPDAVRAFWDARTIHEDTGFGVELSGSELFAMPDGFFIEYPLFAWEIDEILIADGVALDVSRGWGVELRGQAFTREFPLWEVDRTEIDAAGKIGRWTLYYGLETYALWRANETRMTSARELLARYAAAWGSGSPDEVGAIYVPDAGRVDSLFGRDQGGRGEIEAWAKDFFRRYPTVTLTPGIAFGDNLRAMKDPERVGSLFTMLVEDGVGGTCSLTMAVILAAREGRIIAEEVFWSPVDIVTCGWAS